MTDPNKRPLQVAAGVIVLTMGLMCCSLYCLYTTCDDDDDDIAAVLGGGDVQMVAMKGSNG
eukprot:3026331-Prymnesium_polylepis.1